MKVFFRLVLFMALVFLCQQAVQAEDDGLDYGNIDGAWDLQKPVTDAEFEKAIETKFGKRKPKKNKNGSPILQQSQNPDSSNDMAVLYSLKESQPTIMIPVDGYTTQGVSVSPGFYRIVPSKVGDAIYLNLYQGTTLMAKLNTKAVKEDHGAKELTFAKFAPVNDDFVKIVYGCIDYNVEAIIIIKK